ncbi:MAG: class II aldolase/adducin family protein [Verrucomicrobiota bacterium]|jgi:rhamnose utilization protein RhaD (predicted bifunctional aldolase and dehydrogenase)
MQRKIPQTHSAAPAPDRREKLKSLIELSRLLADPAHPLAILGEGNASARLSDETFLVKASGCSLGTLDKNGLVECRSKIVLPLLDKNNLSDAEVDGTLLNSRLDDKAKKPSVEALFHAWLLSLPGIEFVGHTHAPAVLSVLCSPRAREFSEKRIFPDEIVCCDVASVFIPYTDPGLKLAQAIRVKTEEFIRNIGRPPRVILMENHGIITLGRSIQAVLSAMLMAEKTAGVWVGAATLGGPKFMTPEHVARISGRPDEAVRRKMLKL